LKIIAEFKPALNWLKALIEFQKLYDRRCMTKKLVISSKIFSEKNPVFDLIITIIK